LKASIKMETASRSVPERLIDGAIALLAKKGPESLKARAIAAASGMSSMVVYSHFGGVPELVSAMADRGFEDLAAAFAAVPITDDPVIDLFGMATACRNYARANPHLYDLMFGLSARATYRPSAELSARSSERSTAFRAAHAHVIAGCERLVRSGRVEANPPAALAAQLWSYVHGYISLEVAGHFAEFEDPMAEVLAPMGIAFCIGIGDRPARAIASHEAARKRYAAGIGSPTIRFTSHQPPWA